VRYPQTLTAEEWEQIDNEYDRRRMKEQGETLAAPNSLFRWVEYIRSNHG
jgi:hypothetical protein